MKVYSIGREVGCDIVINDSSDVISRRHAILNVLPSGKMTIVDQSHNGTYVNGIRISPNVPVPVTRKDNVSFAHVARLDWNLIPKPTSIWVYVIIALLAIAVIVGAVFLVHYLTSDKPSSDTTGTTIQQDQPEPKPEHIDSCLICKKPVTECEFKGKHPAPVIKCATCGKSLTDCKYKGKHPTPPPVERKCKTCKKPISQCQYKGKHTPPPTVEEKCKTCGKAIKECPFKGQHQTRGLR